MILKSHFCVFGLCTQTWGGLKKTVILAWSDNHGSNIHNNQDVETA